MPAAGSECSRRPLPAARRIDPRRHVRVPFGQADQPFLYVSPQSEAVLGLTHEEMMVGSAERVRRIHPDDRGRVLQDMATLERVEGGTPSIGSCSRTARAVGSTIEPDWQRPPTTDPPCGSACSRRSKDGTSPSGPSRTPRRVTNPSSSSFPRRSTSTRTKTLRSRSTSAADREAVGIPAGGVDRRTRPLAPCHAPR